MVPFRYTQEVSKKVCIIPKYGMNCVQPYSQGFRPGCLALWMRSVFELQTSLLTEAKKNVYTIQISKRVNTYIVPVYTLLNKELPLLQLWAKVVVDIQLLNAYIHLYKQTAAEVWGWYAQKVGCTFNMLSAISHYVWSWLVFCRLHMCSTHH